MIENGEFQKILQKYPDDIPVAICVEYNNQKALLYDIKVDGIAFEGMKAVIIINDDLNFEYETLMNGCEINEEIYRE